MSNNYVTADGFEKKTLAEIKSEREADYQEIFGENIDLSPDQPFGQIIALESKRDADLWDGLQEIYTARNPQEAIGTSLDNIVAENGIQRLSATPTTVENVTLKGDEGTIVSAGKLAKQSTGTIEYSLDATVTIQASTAVFGSVSVANVLDSTLYTITIDATGYTYTSDADATALEILNGLKASIDAGAFAGTTTVDTDNELLEIQDTTAFSLVVDVNLTIEEVGVYGDFTATSNGANTLPATSLDEIVTPVTGWDSVSNSFAGTTGRAVEEDPDLRLRREQSVGGIGNATEEAIRANILNDVAGVTGVAIYSNRSSSTDSEDRPPHSFEAVVQGGDDDEISEKIWETQPAGIASTGNINSDGSTSPTIPGTGIDIIDSQGFTQNILWSRPETIFIWVKVKRDLYDEEVYPSDGDDLIKQSIVDWSLDINNIDVGKDVIRQRLATPIYEVPGIEDIEITLDSSTSEVHTPTYTATNIAIGDRQIAEFAVGRIEVEDLTP